jgi:hypothetical protein
MPDLLGGFWRGSRKASTTLNISSIQPVGWELPKIFSPFSGEFFLGVLQTFIEFKATTHPWAY